MTIANYKHTAEERFLKYVQIDTEADPNSATQPSSFKQMDLSKLLVEELHAMGVVDAQLDEFGYVYATIPSNVEANVPVLCFCSHVDTSPDVTGKGVKPVVHRNYNGGDIHFADDETLVLSPAEHPYLKDRIGDTIITASGQTLLGADDKAGVAIIMDFANFLIQHPEVKHGAIKLLFTPDEEIGRGVNAIDMKKLGADFGYTLDGGPRGSLEGESFSADGMTVIFEGVSAHPGYAKGKMVSAIKVAAHFVELLPKDRWSPETTSGMQGFVHPLHIEGGIEKTSVQFIIRDFETSQLAVYEQQIEEIAKQAIAQFPGATYQVKVSEQYRNMREILDQYPMVMQNAEEAYQRAGLTPKIESIRGGTDGSRLSFMGLPCPNIFTGEMAIHSRKEYVSVEDMQKAVECLMHLVQVWLEKGE
ncbi:MAG: peptidase T [Bacteroidota bacterium]|nr:peptidase T [Bacteroidota bacterium]